MSTHPEWTKEHSLTAPADRNRDNRWRPEQSEPPLTNEQADSALGELNNTAFVDRFPRVDRTYADPAIPMQTIGLISFTPAKGATANKDGVFGFAKLRGNYASDMEASQRAEYLIRNVDSYHQIYHAYVGRPFPITASSKYSSETSEVDIRKSAVESVSSNIKEKQMDDRRTITEIRNREEALKRDTNKEPEDVEPMEEYTTLRVKKAQLTFTYLEHKRLMAEVKESLIRTRERVAEMDAQDKAYKEEYYERYMEARRESGIKQSDTESQDNFIKYMLEDVDLGF